jgi:hypothetical protein
MSKLESKNKWLNKIKEKSNANRMVRLVCVFIKAMIKHKNINPKELFIEVYYNWFTL